MDQALPAKALLPAPRDPAPAGATTIARVAREYGVSPLRQLREMWALKRGPGKLDSFEYHDSRAFDPALPMAAKKTYVGIIGSYNINARLSPHKLTETRALLRDKVMYTALLDRLGVPTTHTQAVVHAFRTFGQIPVLRTPRQVASFLRDAADYPIFAKPCEGACSVGSALITAREGDNLRLSNGRVIDLAAFAAEVTQDYPEGFILQSAIPQHPDLTRVTGPAIGTLRMVTIRDAAGAEVLYTVWKIPSPRAMSDNFWQAGSMCADIGPDGRVQACKKGGGLDAEWIDRHPVSGIPFKGIEIPHWDAIQRTARAAHMLFPEFGIVGWDIAVGPEGPVIVECNDNPLHALYQSATGRGILNPDIAPRLDAAAARSEEILRGKIDAFKARERAKGRRTR